MKYGQRLSKPRNPTKIVWPMNDVDESNRKPGKLLPWLLSVAAAAAMVLALNLLGRIWWCKYGDPAIYVKEAWNSPHTSQHLLDPYTFTHVLHGVVLFWLTVLIFPKLENTWRFFIATVAEAGWEVLENTSFIIEKYRANTASLDYFGDSILNSAGDLGACAAGFIIAARLGPWRSLAFFIAVELFLLLWIRDGLLLNILMLIYPLDAIKIWQTSV